MAGRVTSVAGVGTANELGLRRFEPFLAWIASRGGHAPAKDTLWLSEYVSWLETFHREIPNLKGRAVGDALARSSRIVVTKAKKGHRMFEMRPPDAPPLAPLTLAPAAPRPPPAATRPSLTAVATLARKNAHLLRDIRALTAQRDKHRDRARELPVLQKKVERLERRVVKLKKGGRRVQQQLRRVKARVDVAQLQRLVPQGDVVLLQKSLREAAEEVETLQKSLISEKAQSADVERQLMEKLQLMAEPLTARSGGAVSQHVRAAVVELAAQVNVGFRNVPKAMGVVVGLLEKLSLEQRCVEFGVTGHQMDKDTVINCCLESAELQKLYFASKVFSQTTKDDGYRGVTLRFDATSTKYEYRHLMVACIGVGNDNFDYSLSDWLCGEGAAEHSAFLSSVVRDVMDRQIMLCLHCKLGALAATHGRALRAIVYEEVCARTAWSPIHDVDNVEPVVRDLALDKLRPVASSVARADEIAEQLLALEPGDRHRRVASLSNDDRFQALRALQKKSHKAVQELASPDLWAEFDGAQTLSEKLQVLLADNISGASRVGIFLSIHKSLRRELFQCALATCLESTIQKYKGDLIELVTSDEAQKILQQFGGGHRAHNRDCERGLGAALVDAARRNNKMMRASTMLALSLGRKPYVKLDNIEGSCLKGLPQRVLRQLARKVRKDAPTQKRRADAAAVSALIKRQQVDNKRDTQTKAAQEKADDVANSLSTTVKWTALPSKLPTVEVLRIQLAHNGVSPNFREKLFINFDGSVMTVPDALTPYGTAVKSKPQIVALLKLFLNDNVVAEREQRAGKSCIVLSKRAAPAPAPASIPEVSQTVISDVEMAPPPAATPSPAPAAATAAAPDADAPRKRRRKAPVRTNL